MTDPLEDLYKDSNVVVVPLYTRDGKHVVTVPILPYAVPPEAVLWGERFFVRRADGKYYEGFCHYVTRFESNAVEDPADGNGSKPDDETKRLPER